MEEKKKKPWRRSLQVRFALTYIAVIAAVLLLLNIYPVMVAQDFIFKSKQDSLQSQTAVMASALAGLETLSKAGVERVMEQLDSAGLTRVLVTDTNAMVLYDSAESGGAVYRYALLQETRQALSGNTVFYSVYQNGQFESRAASPIVYRNGVIGTVILYEEDAEQAALLQRVQNNLTSLSLVVTAVVIVVSVLLSKAMTSRVSALLKAIGIVREGNYSHRIQLRGRDELAQMADEFNQLTGRLQTTEEVRRRFVSDASHELKTPLASIRLLTDSILQSESIDMDTAREFVGDIGEEADRLIRISERLLTLTRLDAQLEPVRTPTRLEDVVGRVEHMLRPLANAGQIELTCQLERDCTVEANPDDLYQIVFNLIENAIKYNYPGGQVLVRLWRREGEIFLQVEDTGVGIPEEDLDRVFDRFYRVDKARSRAAGGTGLGLSIVRSMARQYGGAVSARRNQPKGSVFLVRLPAWEGAESAGEEKGGGQP
ncbi:MAG: HAMP domain-containing histidine kinase [Oscillospiraceae bacterium]|nr:HAMP domain-containing histidine kinase [Oscillospiraceae bacterium]